jgi:hypothetical protein
MATGVLLRARPVLRERRTWWFVGLEVGTLAVAAALAIRGRFVGAAVNVALGAGFAVVWWWTGLRPQAAAPPRRYPR